MRYLLFLIFWFAGCGQPGVASHPKAAYIDQASLVREAPIIVLGTVQGIEIIGGRQDIAGVRARLWRVSLNVECIIKGNFGPGHGRFLLYAYDPESPANGSLERISVGTRAFFFLRKDEGIDRAFVDLYTSHIDYFGDRQVGCEPTSDAAETIGSMLVGNRRVGGHSTDLAGHLRYGIAVSLQVAGFSFARRAVGQMLGADDDRVRDAACVASMELLFGDDSCVASLALRDADTAARLRDQRVKLQGVLRRALDAGQPSPLIDYATGVDRRHFEEVLDFYTILCSSRDTVIRASAQREVHRLTNGLKGPA